MPSRKTLVEIGAGGLLFAAIALFHQQIMLAALVVAGRSPDCPARLALQSNAVMDRQGALARSLRANSRLIETNADGLQKWDTPAGVFWTLRASREAFFYDLAEQERGIYSDGGRGARQGDIVLDCGANIGVYTRTVLNAGAARVIAIEPAPDNLACLRKTFALEIEAGRVVIAPEGVWDRDDTLEMNIVGDNQAANSFVRKSSQNPRTLRLPLTTIDKIVDRLGLPRVDYIKMDIEGAERRALAGASATLARFRPRMAICVYHLPDDPQAIPAVIQRARVDYSSTCGPCVVDAAIIKPEVFFYY